jgi:hypothetical protein
MLQDPSSFIRAITEVKAPPFSLRDLPGFPYSEYADRLRIYTEQESWYNGSTLDATVQRAGTEVEAYPVKINPLRAGVQKHTFALFGEVEEDDQPLVSPKMIFTDDREKELADKAEEVLKQLWYESNGRAIQWQNGGLSQVYGGCVFKLSYDPFDTLRTIPIRIDIPHPKYFVGKPSSSDMFRLREAWIVRPISQEEAFENGYKGSFKSPHDVPWLIEYWSNLKYNAWVNDQPVKRFNGNEWFDVSGANPFGFVPIVYIPHIRIDGFYGENMFDHVKGIIKELNLRVADFGDAVNTDAHAYMGMRNVQGSPDIVTLAPGVNAINLGNALALAGNESVPDLWDLRKERASDAMNLLVGSLYDQYRRDAFIPKVADGEDEGSQRSGLTLAMRMLSLLWHTQSERVFWTTGLNLINRMALRMVAIKESARTGITIEHASLRMKQDWSPVLPRDREMIVNEVVARAGANLGSLRTLLEILGDVQDLDQEEKDIIDFVKKIAEAQAVQQPAFPGASPGRKKVSAGTPTGGGKTSSE